MLARKYGRKVTRRFEPVPRDRLALKLVELIDPLEDAVGRGVTWSVGSVGQLFASITRIA